MNKTELIEYVANQTDTTKIAAARSVDAVIDAIGKTLANGDQVSILGFGTFEVRQRAARAGKNPATGKAIQIAATSAPAFRAGKTLKTLVSKNNHKIKE